MKISEHGKQRLHTLYMQDKSAKMKIFIYTYWKLGKPGQFKQLQNTAPQAMIDCATIWTATWLYNIVLSENLASWILDPRSSKLETRSSRLDPCISKLEAFELRYKRIESWDSSFECRLTFERYCIFYRFKEPGSLQFCLEHRIVWGLGTTQNSPKIHMNYRGQLMKFLHT